ncbi:hypothetical protein ACDX78_02135 [Virgibacillus oceani]
MKGVDQMRVSELISLLEKAKEKFGDLEVISDCSKEGIVNDCEGVYLDKGLDKIRIADEDIDEIKDFVKETNYEKYIFVDKVGD